jgi:hypothetical protein
MTLILTRSAGGRERWPGGEGRPTHRCRSLEQALIAREPAPSDADRRQLGDAAPEQAPRCGVQPVARLVRRGGQRQVEAQAGGGRRRDPVMRPSRRSTRSTAMYENGHETAKKNAVGGAGRLSHAARGDNPRRSLKTIKSPMKAMKARPRENWRKRPNCSCLLDACVRLKVGRRKNRPIGGIPFHTYRHPSVILMTNGRLTHGPWTWSATNGLC